MLKAEADGGPVTGQVAVNGTDHIRGCPWCPPTHRRPRRPLEALADADQIVLGPGSLFTSVLAAVAVPRILDGINASPAQRIYVCNLRPQDTETAGYDVAMHVAALLAHGVGGRPGGVRFGRRSRSASRAVPVVDVPLARPNGLAHDPARLAQTLVRSARMIPRTPRMP